MSKFKFVVWVVKFLRLIRLYESVKTYALAEFFEHFGEMEITLPADLPEDLRATYEELAKRCKASVKMPDLEVIYEAEPLGEHPGLSEEEMEAMRKRFSSNPADHLEPSEKKIAIEDPWAGERHAC